VKEAEILEQKACERGEVLPSEERFDSNCITPGTEFMARLHEQLKYFVTYKVSMDTLWHNVQVILSGHEVSISVVRHHFFFQTLSWDFLTFVTSHVLVDQLSSYRFFFSLPFLSIISSASKFQKVKLKKKLPLHIMCSKFVDWF
jgi:hypothetical protein